MAVGGNSSRYRGIDNEASTRQGENGVGSSVSDLLTLLMVSQISWLIFFFRIVCIAILVLSMCVCVLWWAIVCRCCMGTTTLENPESMFVRKVPVYFSSVYKCNCLCACFALCWDSSRPIDCFPFIVCFHCQIELIQADTCNIKPAKKKKSHYTAIPAWRSKLHTGLTKNWSYDTIHPMRPSPDCAKWRGTALYDILLSIEPQLLFA